jgi:hypothetical protein
MKLTVTFRAPEPGQLADGECFAQPFYRLWGGEGQPIVDGVFEGVGVDARAAYDDAVRRIEAEALCYGGDKDDPVTQHCANAYRLASATRPPSIPGGPFSCVLHFSDLLDDVGDKVYYQHVE